MADIPYRTWALLSRDLEPPTQEPILRNPPLMPNLALDAGGSLQFDLQGSLDEVTLAVSVTALSAEGRADGFLQILTGPSGALRPTVASWSQRQDDTTVILEARLGAAGPSVKLHLPDGPPLVVTAVSFQG